MKNTKYLLVAKLPEPEERVHAEMQRRLKEEIPSLRTPSSAIGAHITICQPSTLINHKKLKEMTDNLAYFLYRIESLHISLTGWNFFNDSKTNHKILYRVLDANKLVHRRLCEIRETSLKYIRPIGPTPLYPHFHQTLGNMRCKQQKFNALAPTINEIVMGRYVPTQPCIDRFILYCKKQRHEDWEIENIFTHVPRS